MPNPNPNAPAAPAAPVTPAPAQTPAPSKPSLTPPLRSAGRPRLTARKALGLDASPAALSKEIVNTNREKFTKANPVVEPAVRAPVAPVATPAPVAAAPDPAPVAPAPEPAAPAKIKLDGKEYTEAELLQKLQAAAAPTPAPAAQAPAAPAALAPTKEEIAAQESQFIENAMKSLDAPLTDAEMDTFLAGGKEAVALFAKVRTRDMATAILQARKQIATSLDPIMRELFGAMKPLVENHASLARYNAEQQFLARHKDFAPHVERARAVAEELLKLYPAQVQQLSAEQFIDEVARQTDALLSSEHKRWFPQQSGNWRAGNAVPVTPAQPAAPAAPAPVAPAQTAAPAGRPARPPVPTLPLGSTPGGAVGWSPKSIAQSLRG